MLSTRNLRLFLMTLFLCAVAPFASAQTRVALPQETLMREPFLSQVQLSPDGQHMAAISSLDGENPQIAIWRTSALGENPRRFGIGGGAARANSRFASIEWVSNDRLLVLMQQPIEIGSGTDGRFFTAVARIVNLDGSSWIEPLQQTGRRSELETYADKFLAVSLLDILPSEPNHVLMMRRGLRPDRLLGAVDDFADAAQPASIRRAEQLVSGQSRRRQRRCEHQLAVRTQFGSHPE
jgi:hypothetical protein